MPSYSKPEDIKPFSFEEFKKAFKSVTTKDFVERGENICEVLVISCHLPDLRFFVTVTSHPALHNLRKSVRKISIDGSTYNRKYATEEAFQKQAKEHKPGCMLRNIRDYPCLASDLQRVKRWHRDHSPEETVRVVKRMYQWYEEEQFQPHFEIRENLLDMKILMQALGAGSFPHLEAWEMTQLPAEREANRGDRPYFPSYRSLNMQMLQEAFPGPVPIPTTTTFPRVSWPFLPKQYYPDIPTELWEVSFSSSALCFHPPPVNVPVRDFNLLLHALETTPKVKELSLLPGQLAIEGFYPSGLESSNGLSLLLFLPEQRETISRLRRVSPGLTTLRLAIDCMNSTAMQLGPNRFEGLVELMKSANKLEVLYLELQQEIGQTGLDILEGIQSRAIREVHLVEATVTPLGIYKLLARSPNLERLILIGCKLMSQFGPRFEIPWFDTLDVAREVGLLHRGRTDFYIDRVGESDGSGEPWTAVVDMGDYPPREEGFRRFRSWRETGSDFPLTDEDGEIIRGGQDIRDALHNDLLRARRNLG